MVNKYCTAYVVGRYGPNGVLAVAKATVATAPALDVAALGRVVEEAIGKMRRQGFDARDAGVTFTVRFQ